MMKENKKLSLEVLLNTLVDFGLKRTDAQIYAFLAKKGSHRGKDLAKALKITKQQVYPSLKKLQQRGIVKSTSKRPAVFSAVSIEEVLDMFIKTRIEETQRLIQNKEEALSKWKSMMRNDSET
jgi:sugar-specific transcriptional regulator TrmB